MEKKQEIVELEEQQLEEVSGGALQPSFSAATLKSLTVGLKLTSPFKLSPGTLVGTVPI